MYGAQPVCHLVAISRLDNQRHTQERYDQAAAERDARDLNRQDARFTYVVLPIIKKG